MLDDSARAKVSLADLTTAADKMALDVSPEKLAEWFQVVNVAESGMISFEEWDAALGYARSEDILRSRGVVLAESGGAELSLDSSTATMPLPRPPSTSCPYQSFVCLLSMARLRRRCRRGGAPCT